MVSIDDTAPSFTATYRGTEHETFELDEHLGDGPTVLAFFPGAFTPPCSNEMVALQERLNGLEEAGATLLGISADSSFTLEAFADEYDLDFDLVSDMSGDAIAAYDLSIDLPDLGLYGAANRAVFVLDEDGTVTYSWVADDPTNEPDYDDLIEAVEAV
jgi:peroxiredoxin